MKLVELIDLCRSFPFSYEDYPFDDTTPVIRHNGNKKIFALITIRNEKLCVNLKCEPIRAVFLRGIYNSIVPGWHMNKEHWNTVFIEGDVQIEELVQMIKHSYDLTKPKTKNLKI